MLYNADQKLEFIRYYAKSDGVAKNIESIFKLIGEIELKYNTDMSLMTDKDQLLEVMSCVSGNRSFGTDWKIRMLKRYIQWASGYANNIDLLDIDANDVNIEYIKNHMASDPDDMKEYMEMFLRNDEDLTIDIVYKCALWMAYSGIQEYDILNVRSGDVELKILSDDTFVIRYAGKEYNVPAVAFDTFKKCVESESFRYTNKQYREKEIMRLRVKDDKLLRGVRATSKSFKAITQRISQKAQSCNMKRRINYTNAALSGFFYHLYILESYNKIDFKFFAQQYLSERKYKLDKSRLTMGGLINKVADNYERDYNLWKIAFNK